VTSKATGGQRSRIAATSAKPSIDPGICTSVKTAEISGLVSSKAMA